MTLDDWVAHGWLKEHAATPEEISKLFDIVHRETTDAASTSISLDAQLGMLYNATLKLADIALRHRGFRATHQRHHYRVITSVPLTLGVEWKKTTFFLEAIQRLRHRADYETVGLATKTQVDELAEIVRKLRTAVRDLVR